ncbi:MAG: hypothetical protein GF411_07885 [Candidatus Lokiarchaeota archaeon]|nr:hypothetical protein [Candidatus Lokiarchaeota archaeon]
MKDSITWDSDQGCFLRVVVKPKSREENLVAEIEQKWIVINLKSAAREGKANTELVKRLSKLLGRSSSEILLVRGHRSREKILQIFGMSAGEVLSIVKSVHKQ